MEDMWLSSKLMNQEIPWKFTESSTEHKIIRNIYNEERRCADCIAALLFTEVSAIEIKIPKEVRDYHENIFFGLNTRQFICSVLAVGVAVGIYFALQPYVGTEEIGWMCILGAAPFAACGFFTYHGMTAEQVLWAWFKSEILCPKRLMFKSDSYYYETLQPAIRAGMKRKRGLPMKKNTHNSEETA